MSLSSRWLVVWFIITLILGSILFWQYRQAQPGFPRVVDSLSINGLQLKNNQQRWQAASAEISDAQQQLINTWLHDLRQGCQKLATSEQIADDTLQLTFALNQRNYAFGGYNPLLNAHYLYYDGQTYLCQAGLKPRLENANTLWITPDA
ncbi:hypothetical protein L0B52_01495 [Suttonella sp. R2A3]|uniref:hypothetical protein n=1 Tax=Suttonella sp. R2A3 TaxID=2908648 RepID=UPI001F40FE8C|nr:hypothetical protein [Suttonella sp. R2A3]UJF24838.1 hypothetical protein L0B52_01495 [Suttonella sp. R2A3]